MSPTTTRGCDVVTELCMDAPDRDTPVRTRCFACGQPACRDCTTVVARWYRWKRKRVCLDCLTDHGRADEAIAIVLAASGYDPDTATLPSATADV
jgi:hypothetical protein